MIEQLAKLLGLSRDDAEASLHSERAARHVLNRRSAIGLGAAMCAGFTMGDSFGLVRDDAAYIQGLVDGACGPYLKIPHGDYVFKRCVIIRGAMKHFDGGGSRFSADMPGKWDLLSWSVE